MDGKDKKSRKRHRNRQSAEDNRPLDSGGDLEEMSEPKRSPSRHGSLKDEADETPTFPAGLVRQLMLSCNEQEHHGMRHTPTRMSAEAVDATAELLRMLVMETCRRASIEAECDQEENADFNSSPHGRRRDQAVPAIQPEHVSKIAADLLLDLV
jgi:CENP-S associating Centromere protein X